MDGSIFLNSTLYKIVCRQFSHFFLDAQTRAALHAPTSKDWTLNFPFVFGNLSKPVHGLDHMAYVERRAWQLLIPVSSYHRQVMSSFLIYVINVSLRP